MGSHPRAENRLRGSPPSQFFGDIDVVGLVIAVHSGQGDQETKRFAPYIRTREAIYRSQVLNFLGGNHSTHRSLRKAAEALWWILPKAAGTNSEEEE